MEMDFFKSIARQAKEIGVKEIRLFLAGEPFVHKGIADMAAFCTEVGLRSIIHTNGMLLDNDKSQAIIDAGLSVISFSIDSADPKTYEAARAGAKFDRVIENAKTLLSLIKERKAKEPYVIIQSIVPVGQELVPDKRLTDLFEGLPVGHFKVLHPHNWRGEADVGESRKESETPNPCMFLWHELSVGWDGKVLGCCADLNGSFIRGDLTKESILDVWNNEKSMGIRGIHGKQSPFEHPLCAQCSVPFQNHKVTSLSNLYKQRLKRVVKSLLGRK